MKTLKAQGLKIGLVVAVVVVVTVLAQTFSGYNLGSAIAAIVGGSGGAITKVNVVTEDAARSGSPVIWTNLPGASTVISVPAGENALILARFSAESQCDGGSGYCTMRILIGGVEANPVTGSDFAFDSDGGDVGGSWESHSMDRSRRVGPGNYTVQVQWGVTDVTAPATVFRLDDWSLTVERAQAVP